MNQYIKGLEIDWKKISTYSYLYEIDVLRNIRNLDFTSNITFFVGENGTGKSTLLEAIAVAYGFNPEGGTMNYRFSVYNDVSELSKAVRLKKGVKRPPIGYFFRAENFYNLATKAEEYDRDNPRGNSFGEKGLHNQSHGESFLSFFQTFQGNGLYLLDEPEAALSPQRQLSLFIQIAKSAKEGAQFIIATHSPILLAVPGAEILSFDRDEVSLCSYEETESYQVMEMFINNREPLVNRLLREE